MILPRTVHIYLRHPRAITKKFTGQLVNISLVAEIQVEITKISSLFVSRPRGGASEKEESEKGRMNQGGESGEKREQYELKYHNRKLLIL